MKNQNLTLITKILILLILKKQITINLHIVTFLMTKENVASQIFGSKINKLLITTKMTQLIKIVL